MTMKRFLPKEDWIHLAPDKPGRIRVNHIGLDCAGGRDSMVVERKSNGNLTAFCYRCSRSGWDHPPRSFVSPAKAHVPVPPVAPSVSVTPPDDCREEWHSFPREAREWLLRGGITSVIAAAQGIGWSDSSNQLWIPARQYSKVTTGYKDSGYVLRGFNPKTYYTRTADKDNMYGYYVSGVINNTIIIVEDIISAIKCSQVADSIALLGTHPKPAMIQKVLKEGYKKAFVFLDADNPQVRMKAREIPKRLPFISCKIIETGSDPKYLTKEQIEELIK